MEILAMKRIFGALVFSFLVALPSVALAKTIYVDLAHQSGVEDGSPANPFYSVTRGYGAALAGDTIIIRAESYPERLTLSKAITIKSEGGATIMGLPPLLPYDLVSTGPDDKGQGQKCALDTPRWDYLNNIPKNPFWGFQVTNCAIPDPRSQCYEATHLVTASFTPPPEYWYDQQHPCTQIHVTKDSGFWCGPHVDFRPVMYEGRLWGAEKTPEGGR
jgi:hypothetical protein